MKRHLKSISQTYGFVISTVALFCLSETVRGKVLNVSIRHFYSFLHSLLYSHSAAELKRFIMVVVSKLLETLFRIYVFPHFEILS